MITAAEYQSHHRLKFFPVQGQKAGQRAELLVVSGIHGNEDSVIPHLFRVLHHARAVLPAHIYIPVMSQLAVNAGSRCRPDGIDLNRAFTMTDAPEEVQQAKDFAHTHGPFRTVLSVHEDDELPDSYAYIEGNPIRDRRLAAWRAAVAHYGHKLHTGYDDVTDPALGMWVENGHVHSSRPDLTPQMFESWMVVNGFAEQAITLEVPTSASDKAKAQLVTAALALLGVGE